jgi:phosphomannomutase
MSNYHSVFKAYDMRGIPPVVNEKVYYLVGKALIEKICIPQKLSTNINLVHDCRLNSPLFYKALFNGILDAGGKPFGLGLGSTDFLYASTQITQTPGVMITASHNPKEYNGAKIVKEGCTMLGLENGLDIVRDYVIENIEKVEINEQNWVEADLDLSLKSDVEKYFKDKIVQIGQIEKVDKLLTKQGRKLKIAVDCGNGMGGFVMERLAKMYQNIEFVDLYWQPDGNYPNHPADPQNFENLKDLQKIILEDETVDFGIAFDGDADRAFFVDDKAEVIQGDFLVSFFAEALLKAYFENPNPKFDSSIVYIQPGSTCAPETVAQSSGVAIPSKQGHTHIKSLMQKYRAIYGGEFSGHHYFGDFGYMDSGVLAAVLLIKIMVESEKDLSKTFKALNDTYFISDLIAIKLAEGTTFEDFRKKLKIAYPDAKYGELDGLTVYYPDWKFSIRSSNTEPVVKMILETKLENKVDQKLAEVKKILGVE